MMFANPAFTVLSSSATRHRALTPNARAHASRPESRSLLRHEPFPFYVADAHGIHSTDLDGNRRIDFHNNYTTMIHGHGHPQIQARSSARSNAVRLPAPGAQEFELVQLLCERIAVSNRSCSTIP